MNPASAVLLLEDGTRFEGLPFGAVGETTGETVFYTGVVGYQEVVTSPSYRGTLAVLTYPIVGSYGVNPEDDESAAPQARGVVIKEYSRHYSNYRATGAFEDLLAQHGIVGIRGVDTRAVAVHLRERGEQRGVIASGGAVDEARLLARLRAAPSPFAADLLAGLPAAQAPPAAGDETARLAVLDLGVTRSLLAHLASLGAALDVLPATARADEMAARDAVGVVVAGGPGDPRVPTYAVDAVRGLVGRVPVLGVGLGHQVLALALGCRVERMRTGHHGVNHSVREQATGHCDVTTQHHSFAVDAGSVPEGVEITHVNLNDGTVEGIRSKGAAALSVQFHPSPDDTGRPHRLLAGFVGRR